MSFNRSIVIALSVSIFFVLAFFYSLVGFTFRNNPSESILSRTPLDRMYSDYGLDSSTPQPSDNKPKPSPTSLSSGIVKNIDVSFTSQAPFAVWDDLHEEACEEASILMSYAWIKNKPLSAQYADDEIHRMVDWQKEHFGYFEDTDAEHTLRFARELYNKILNNPSREQLKKEIDKGNIIVMGVAGRVLQNPYFTPPGPDYHMLVIRGYDDNGFITNDPGTRRGAGFHYTYENLMSAANDWNASSNSLADSSAAIVFSRD